jgi:hypothetical protein
MWRRSWTRIGSTPTGPRRAATGNRRNRFPGQGVVGRRRGQRQASGRGGPTAPWRDAARTGGPPRLPSVSSQSDSAVSSAGDGHTVREPRPRVGRVPGCAALPPACCRCPPRSAGCTASRRSPRRTRGATSIQADRCGFDPRRLLSPATPQVTARERLCGGDGIRYSPWSCSPPRATVRATALSSITMQRRVSARSKQSGSALAVKARPKDAAAVAIDDRAEVAPPSSPHHFGLGPDPPRARSWEALSR